MIAFSGGAGQAQETPLFEALFGQDSSSGKKKKSSSSSKYKKKSSSQKKSSSSSSSEKTDLLTALTGKTPEERAREEYLRKKAAEKKAKEDARKKALAAAQKKKADEQKARAAAARKKALAEQRAKEEHTRRLAMAAREKEARLREVEMERLKEQQRVDAELVALARGNYRPKLFGNWSRSNNSRKVYRPQVTQPTRYLYINEREVNHLNASNSRIEIDLGDQRARVFRGSVLVIETQISSGKPGFSTPTGRYSVKEKLVEKKSGRYGTWYNSQGLKLSGDDQYDPPPGGVKFVGADMPYWLRITGGIGMHVGYVPEGPASHGCIRVPSSVQPLIYSKVKVGTPVTIKG